MDMSNTPKPTMLAEKAMLVKLTQRNVSFSRRDKDAEEQMKAALGDESLTAYSHLFRDATNPINRIKSALSEVYTYHRLHTLPWVDKGPRVLPTEQYMDYTQKMRGKIAELDRVLDQLMPDYDKYVQQDIDWRTAQAQKSGKPMRAKVEDYPSAEEFREKISLDVRFMPMPDKRHFLFDISEEDEKAFDEAMVQAEQFGRKAAVEHFTVPLKHLVDKLVVPVGATDEGGKKLGIFRDSAIENVLDGLQRAKKLLLEDDPELDAIINALEKLMGVYNEKKDWLRESPVVRADAAKKLAEIAGKMDAWMGA